MDFKVWLGCTMSMTILSCMYQQIIRYIRQPTVINSIVSSVTNVIIILTEPAYLFVNLENLEVIVLHAILNVNHVMIPLCTVVSHVMNWHIKYFTQIHFAKKCAVMDITTALSNAMMEIQLMETGAHQCAKLNRVINVQVVVHPHQILVQKFAVMGWV